MSNAAETTPKVRASEAIRRVRNCRTIPFSSPRYSSVSSTHIACLFLAVFITSLSREPRSQLETLVQYIPHSDHFLNVERQRLKDWVGRRASAKGIMG
jgi:hypothetical protein